MGEPGAGASTGPSAGTDDDGSRGGCGDSDVHFSTENLDPAVVAAMTADELKKFIDTGRTGRRNALPDVTQPEVSTTSTAGVAEAMESLSMQNADKEKSSSDAGS